MAVEKFKETFNFADMTDYGNGFFGTSLDLGAIITDKDGNPMPSGTFTFENKVYETDDMGAISSIEDAKEEAEEDANGGDDSAAKIAALETQVADLQAQLSEATATKMANEEAEVKLKADFEAEKESNVKLTAEVEKLKADVIEAKKIPEMVDKGIENMSALEKYRMKKETLK